MDDLVRDLFGPRRTVEEAEEELGRVTKKAAEDWSNTMMDGQFALHLARTAIEERESLFEKYQELRRSSGKEIRRLKENLEHSIEERRRLQERVDEKSYLPRICLPEHVLPFRHPEGKLPTIKILRILTGLDLKAAKDMVDSWYTEAAEDENTPTH